MVLVRIQHKMYGVIVESHIGILSIDDINVGCPLRYEDNKYLVDWIEIEKIVEPILKKLNDI